MNGTHCQLVMLPSQDWKVVKIIKFRFVYHLCNCTGTIVYTRPLSQTYNKDSKDQIDECILQAIGHLYSGVQIDSDNLLWKNQYCQFQRIYDGGRPKTTLTIRMIPDIDVEMMPKFTSRFIYAYDVNLNIFLDYLEDQKNIPSEVFTTGKFSYNDDKLFSKEIQHILSL